MSRAKPVPPAKQELVVEAIRADQRSPFAGSLGPVNIGIYLPPGASAHLASTHPKEFLDLTKQVDEHQYEIAKTSWEVDHAQTMKRIDNDHAEKTTILANEKVDREETRKYGLYFTLIAAGLLVALLLFAGWTGDREVVKSVIERVGILVGGILGGYGIRGSVEDRRRKRAE